VVDAACVFERFGPVDTDFCVVTADEGEEIFF
jgi:hypothetical protein